MAPIICYCQVEAANNAPITYSNRVLIFNALISYLLLLGLPALTIFFSTLPIRIYIGEKYSGNNSFYKQIFRRELVLFYIPFTIVYFVSAIVFYIISLILDPFTYVETYAIVSNITVVGLLLFSAYVSIYSIWAVLIKNRRKAFMIGLSSTIVVSIISLFVMFTINVLFGRFYFLNVILLVME